MTKPTLESLQAEIDALRQRQKTEHAAVTFWLLQLFLVSAGQRPDSMARWVRLRMELLRRTAPPDDGSITGADYDRGLLEIMPAISTLGNTIAEDLDHTAQAIEKGEAQPVILSEPEDMPGAGLAALLLAPAVEQLAKEQLAMRYWLTEAYHLMSGGHPGVMADRLRTKLSSLKNEPPIGPRGVSPEDLDKAMLIELPPILEFGERMSAHLASAAARRASE